MNSAIDTNYTCKEKKRKISLSLAGRFLFWFQTIGLDLDLNPS